MPMPEGIDDLTTEELRRIAKSERDKATRDELERIILERSNALVLKWQRFAYDFAEPYHKLFPHSKWDDIDQEALLGLVEASKMNDDKKGEFSTIAAWYMRKNILKFKYKEGRLVVEPRSAPVNPKRITELIEKNGWWRDEDRFDRACDILGVDEVYRSSLRKAWELRDKEFVVMSAMHEPETDLSSQEVKKVDDIEEFDFYAKGLERLPFVVREVIQDYLDGVIQSVTCKRLQISRPSLNHYKELGFKWLKFYLGLGPEPDRRITFRRKPARAGTAVPEDSQQWESDWEGDNEQRQAL